MKIVFPFANQGVFPPAKGEQRSMPLFLYPTQWSKAPKKK
ncbi:hypothetical protein EDC28_10189 [Gallaecimonas pentaromativorans]|uniref:Uncharacterized protein n=1 Tax=Gallaecimonas pentaromativorans TaxID=584787 RepID=A0A3N1PPG2_9GAMM|nr:hypothetical protein EDC28_10189 [Gallaecimonas pentaromativorans]